MPQIYRRRSQSLRPKNNKGLYYIPVSRKRSTLPALLNKVKNLPKRFLVIMGAAVLVVALGITVISLLGGNNSKFPVINGSGRTAKPAVTPTATDPTVTLPPRQAALAEPAVTPEAIAVRDISFGAMNMQFKEKQINQPAAFGNELFFSAGTGSLDSGAVLKKLYLYNIQTGVEKKIADTKISYGEFYETQINKSWMVWLETDHHTFNYIYVMDRKTGKVSQIKNCKNGKPKLRLAGNTLIWMEEVDKDQDQLMMFDLSSQDNMSLFTFKDVATYGVSAPCIYDASAATGAPSASSSPKPSDSASASPSPSPSPLPTLTPTATPWSSQSPDTENSPDSSDQTTIVWAGPDASQTPDTIKAEGEHSTIYWVALGKDTFDVNGNIKKSSFSPKTYVHEPLYNGKYFVWIDGNYSPNSKLYLSQPNGTPKMIAEGITTYSLGDGIVVYGKGQQVWVYVIDTGETCRLTSGREKGMLPYVNGRTVVWYDLTDGSSGDTLRYKMLSDQDLNPGSN